MANVHARLACLAQALAVDRPALFVDDVQWARAAFSARDVRLDDLRQSLLCTKEVLSSELPGSVASLACGYVEQALEALSGPRMDAKDRLSADAPHRTLVLRYLEALLGGKREDARKLILDAAEGGVPVAQIYEQVLQPAQAELGEMWHLNEVSIAEEHYATATTQLVMSQLASYFPETPAKNRRLVAASVGGDRHDLGIRMVADFFQMDGWEVYFLGSDVPSFEVVETVRRHNAHVLAASANTSMHVRTVGELIASLRQSPGCEEVKVMVGGFPFKRMPNLWKELGADGFAISASGAVETANRLVGQTGG